MSSGGKKEQWAGSRETRITILPLARASVGEKSHQVGSLYGKQCPQETDMLGLGGVELRALR